MEVVRRAIAEQLNSRERRMLSADTSLRCAVLVPLIEGPEGISVLYTLRSEGLPSHKGQVAFPGGKRSEHDEDLSHTALREAQEEIGLDPRSVEIIGCLDDVYTLSAKFHITPFVGVLPHGLELRANPGEVSDIFEIPLLDLLDPKHHGSQRRSWGGNDYEVPVISAGRHEIWGVTHGITMNFLECVKQLPSTLSLEVNHESVKPA